MVANSLPGQVEELRSEFTGIEVRFYSTYPRGLMHYRPTRPLVLVPCVTSISPTPPTIRAERFSGLGRGDGATSA